MGDSQKNDALGKKRMSNVIIVTVEFDAGHRVPLHNSKCQHPHGHRYKAEFSLCSQKLSKEGFVWDFGEAKAAIKGWVDENLDHNMIYQKGDTLMERLHQTYRSVRTTQEKEVKPWFSMNGPPTAELIAELLFNQVTRMLKGSTLDNPVILDQVRLWETPGNSAVHARYG